MRHLKVFICIILVTSLLITINACQSESTKSTTSSNSVKEIIIARSPTQLAILPIIALKKGFFSEQGLNVKEKEFFTGKLCLDAMLGSSADFATVAEMPIAIAAFSQAPISVLGTISQSLKSTKVLARKDKGVSKPASLKGKAIATAKGTNAEYVLAKFLERNGLRQTDVKITYLAPPELVSAFARGDVAAIVVWEPFISKAKQAANTETVVFESGEFYTETFEVVAMKSLVEKSPETVEKFVRALNKAAEFVKSNPEDAKNILAQTIAMDKGLLDGIWNFYNFELELNKSLAVQMRDQAKFGIEQGWVAKGSAIPDYDKILETQILSKIAPNKVK